MLAKPFSPALSHYGKMITNELNVGAKVKFLLGAGNIDARIKSMNVTMGYDKWQLRADGQLNIAVNGLKVPTNQESGKDLDTPDMRNQIDYDGIDLDSFGTGFGLGFDLGATYDMHKFVPGLTCGNYRPRFHQLETQCECRYPWNSMDIRRVPKHRTGF